MVAEPQVYDKYDLAPVNTVSFSCFPVATPSSSSLEIVSGNNKSMLEGAGIHDRKNRDQNPLVVSWMNNMVPILSLQNSISRLNKMFNGSNRDGRTLCSCYYSGSIRTLIKIANFDFIYQYFSKHNIFVQSQLFRIFYSLHKMF